MNEPIKIWKFYEAPKEWQDLSPHGGDEDWVAEIPKSYGSLLPLWMEEGTPFGCCSVSVHDLPEVTIAIGAHA
jgi:hypothetical protein